MPTSYVDGKRIKEIKEKHYGFGCGENHIVLLLGLFVDGFCPFKKEKRNSTWAIKMICYNLPPEVSFVWPNYDIHIYLNNLYVFVAETKGGVHTSFRLDWGTKRTTMLAAILRTHHQWNQGPRNKSFHGIRLSKWSIYWFQLPMRQHAARWSRNTSSSYAERSRYANEQTSTIPG